MYQAPDFVKVSVKVKDVFAGYAQKCPYDFMDTSSYTTNPPIVTNCPTTDPNYTYSAYIYTAVMAPANCYSTLNM